MRKRMTLLVCLVLALMLSACGGKTPAETTPPTTTAPAETAAPETTIPETTVPQQTLPPPAQDHIIPTPYGDLHFPGDWASLLKTEISENPYTIAFFTVLDDRDQPQRLFAISFGGKAETAAAALKTADGYAAVAIDYEEFVPDESWSDQDINIVYTMQDALNHIMENLPLEDADVLKPAEKPNSQQSTPSQDTLTEDAQLPESMQDDLAMDTPYMELHYPAVWADTLSIKVNDGTPYSVGYYAALGSHADLHLFTVYFGGQKGTPLKTIKTESGEMVEIRIEVSELVLDDSWNDEEKTCVQAMQEDLNYLLSKMS